MGAELSHRRHAHQPAGEGEGKSQLETLSSQEHCDITSHMCMLMVVGIHHNTIVESLS